MKKRKQIPVSGSSIDGSTDQNKASLKMVLTGSSLKLLHCLLLKLSPDEHQDICGDAMSMSVSNHWFITRVKHTDIIGLANLLYEELHNQFEHIFFGASYLPFIVVSDQKGGLISDMKFLPEKFILLLRCFMIILRFLEFDLTIMSERCQILVTILRKLSPSNSLPKFPHRSLHPDDMTTSSADRSLDFFPLVLEVFIDELFLHPEMRKHLTLTDSVSSSNEKLFVSHSCHGDIHAILELVCGHFILSVGDDLSFKRFISSLSWSNEVGGVIHELSPDSALQLLGQLITFSAPLLLQTHLILLASRCIGIHMPADGSKSDVLQMNRYILAFELSANLYERYMPVISFTDNIIGEKREASTCDKGISFDFYVRTMTYNKLNHQIEKLIDFCHMHTNGLFSGTTDDILKGSIAYIKENQHFINETFREKTCLILRYIISAILLWEKETSHEDEESIQQEIFCVAAVLKLMSSSLLHIIWLLTQDETLGGMKKARKHDAHCKEYDFILGITSCFRNYSGNQAFQKFIFDVMGANTGRHRETMLMLSHFSSVLLFSRRKKIDFLWKGCIFMLMSLLNLFIFEDGNLDAFAQLLSHRGKASLSHSSLAKNTKDLVRRRSSVRIASNLKRARDEIKYHKYEDHWMSNGGISGMEPHDGVTNFSNILPTKDREKQDTYMTEAFTCNGKSFLKCLPGHNDDQSGWEDLEDFIECKPGKDYSSWLKKRERFRKWKHKKMALPKLEVRNQSIRTKVKSGSSCSKQVPKMGV
ncbi:uncharacterized protein M6B38_297155 [Iris pallida]|uniref:DUF7812 domain-containing protein n=1 Tax=Iris pallida TaxID=29817 RepID=A0AAX6HQB9_IRIPA|nr:uncharacterized protein M6B38_297155 [Iris pallida]